LLPVLQCKKCSGSGACPYDPGLPVFGLSKDTKTGCSDLNNQLRFEDLEGVKIV